MEGRGISKNIIEILKENIRIDLLCFQLKLWEYNKPDFERNQLNTLDNMVTMGAQGLKVIKNLGLEIRDPSGNLVPIDAPRFDPIWDRAGELKIPVLMHLTDPTPFFLSCRSI